VLDGVSIRYTFETFANTEVAASPIQAGSLQIPMEPTSVAASITPVSTGDVVPTGTPIVIHTPITAPSLIHHDAWARPVLTKEFKQHTLQLITLHHEGVYFDGKKESARAYLRSVQRWGQNSRGWADIPYHFIIDLEGRIFEGRPLWAKGDTNTLYDLTGHALIAVLGDYNIQMPNQQQLDIIIWVMAWIAQDYNIKVENIRGHKDYIPVNEKGEHIDKNVKITCPGDHLYTYLSSGYFHREVAKMLGLSGY
jgi:hypothetical protein